MTADAQLLLEARRIFVHESGHAVMAALKKIPCCGIYYDDIEDQFLTLSEQPSSGRLLPEHYLVRAAGSAAELLLFNCYNEQAASGDRKPFMESDAPNFEATVEQARETLLSHKAKLERMRDRLIQVFKKVEGEPQRLPVITVSGRNYFTILREDDIRKVCDNLS